MSSYLNMIAQNVVDARQEAERKAWDSLSRYKFEMFGYWASAWVKYNQLTVGTPDHRKDNPFRELVLVARIEKGKCYGQD